MKRAPQPLKGPDRVAARQERKQVREQTRLVSPFAIGGTPKSLSSGSLLISQLVAIPSKLAYVHLKCNQWFAGKNEQAKLYFELTLDCLDDNHKRKLILDRESKTFNIDLKITNPTVVEVALMRIETGDPELIEVAPSTWLCWATVVFYPNVHSCRTVRGNDESIAQDVIDG